jgi:fatty-acyl-CoA synthase
VTVVLAYGATSLGQLLRRTAAANPRSEIVFPAERVTFAELHARSDAFAAQLAVTGIRAGDHVGLFLDASVDYLVSLFGAARLGCCVVPISDRFRSAELRHVLRHGDLVGLVTTGSGNRRDFTADVFAALPELTAQRRSAIEVDDAPKLRRILVWNAGAELAEPLEPVDVGGPVDAGELERVEAAITPDALAYLMYTSGTSASPKGCLISHRAVLGQAESLAHARYLLTAGDAFWCPLPLFHNGGLATLSACLASGAKLVHTGSFEPGPALHLLAEERCTHAIPAFETIWLRVLDHPDYPDADLSALRVVLNAGTSERLRQLQARTPGVIQLANYGCTEAAGHLSMTSIDDPLEIRLTTGGFPLPGMHVRIVDPETGEELRRGEIGEITFRGPSLFTGYYHDAGASAQAIDVEGWYHSGDRGRVDAEGRVTFLGRLKDMLKVGGENVSASEVEEYLLTHPAVNIAAVVGAPDAYYDEVPAAFVELVAGSEVSEKELIDFCLGQIATYKVPRYVRIVSDWPMSGTKIQKFTLAARLAEELTAQGITAAPHLRATR